MIIIKLALIVIGCTLYVLRLGGEIGMGFHN